MNTIQKILTDTLHLFFPHTCCGCGTDMLSPDQHLCFACHTQLPFTGFEAIANNPVEHIFIGRLPVEAAASTFYFNKGGLMQPLIHRFKYKGQTEIGTWLGMLMGQQLQAGGRFATIDQIVPLPLFAKRTHQRGYNQSELLCAAIGKVMDLPVNTTHLIRQRATATQTRKHRTERWINVADSFVVRHPDQFAHQHLLLIDDVVTTGSTLDACGQALLSVPGLRLSIATLACAGS
jgi:ComF family protein